MCSKHFVGDNCHNKIQYDMGLRKKLIRKEDVTPTVYSVNLNMTRSPPIPSATVYTSMRSVVLKREQRVVHLETQTEPNIGAIH